MAALLVAAIALFATSGRAQVTQPRPTVRVSTAPQPVLMEQGWIGVTVDVNVVETRRGPTNLIVRVRGTVDGGPAAEAGVVPGDVIRAIDGEVLTVERWEGFRRNLRRGVDVRLSLDRAGRSRDVNLTTASRPSLAPVSTGLSDHLDSVRTSFRIRLRSNSDVWASRDYVTLLMAGGSVEEVSARVLDQARQGAVSYRLRRGPPAGLIAPSAPDANRYAVLWNTDVALPFELLMLQSREADSVKSAIIRLRDELNTVSEATRAREQEIRATVSFRARDFGNDDAQLVRLRSDNERVQEDLEELSFRLAEIGSNERESRMRMRGDGVDARVNVRPVSAPVIGRNFVGGAQFNDLSPQLGAYFGTDRGVLVIQVLRGTPCDDAGLVPGDVVTHVGGTEVDSVESFRTVLNGVFARGRRADLRLIRRGERIAATLLR